jgi:hypothetical protein
MHARSSGPQRHPDGFLIRQARRVVLFVPVALFLTASARLSGNARLILLLGALFQLLAGLLVLFTRRGGRDPLGPVVIMLYVLGLSWMLLGTVGKDDWSLRLAEAVLVVVPLAAFAVQCLHESGAPALRRARYLARRLAARRDWPADLMNCRLLPEVKALRDALHIDASPALALLAHPRPEVRVGALAALEFRQNWRHGQPDIILQYAQRAQEPEVRAAAINALGNLESRLIVEGLAEFLRDPSPLVRQTATEALLWNTEGRWAWVRDAVRQALADPATHDDGPLRLGGNVLTAEAVTDLTAWAAEKGGGAIRAALTLGEHYALVLADELDPKLLAELRRQLLDVRTPAVLRYELAKLLHEHRELDDETLGRLLSSTTPAPVRLLAADSLLAAGPCPEAVTALQELARLPNREIALSTADVVQRRLGEDLGLPRGEPLPAVQSRQAAEVARRVLIWSTTPAQPQPEPAAQ